MKVLVIRFSSIGDLTQALSIPSLIHENWPQAEIHFVTRQDLSEIIFHHPHINQVWTLDRKQGLKGLWNLILQLRKQKFTHIYDAHNNLRSNLIRLLTPAIYKLTRPMMRWKRFLLLQFHMNLFEKPFSGQRDLLKPLEKWGMKFKLPSTPQLFLNTQTTDSIEHKLKSVGLSENQFSVLVPSAAYPLKRWPMHHWKKWIELNPQHKFIVLAGAQDDFVKELSSYKNILNWQGATTLLESAAVIQKARSVITNDTGLLHFAEQLGKPTIALMGPAPFGFPSRPSTLILEKDLSCRPCSKHGQGPCRNSNFHECLESISPQEVQENWQKIINQNQGSSV